MAEEGRPAEPGGAEPAPDHGDVGEVPDGEGRPRDGEANGDVELLTSVLEYLARNLVDKPDAVEVTAVPDDRGVLLQLRVDPDDMGRVIGRGGRTARAIRTVVRVASARAGVYAHVEIVGP